MSRNASNLTADDQAFLDWIGESLGDEDRGISVPLEVRLNELTRHVQEPTELALDAGVRGVVVALILAVIAGLGGLPVWQGETFLMVVAGCLGYGLFEMARTQRATHITEA